MKAFSGDLRRSQPALFADAAGLGSDVMKINPHLKTIEHHEDGETLVAMPALKLDVAAHEPRRCSRQRTVLGTRPL